ncbi:ClpXP protease specificity-enhancing factor [Crenobacter cavernae]|uniref:ClpXP protease specificity-enhancing factor n=1 Tax=Crenobacter cavernae TaxID=2290923 RepID=A0A345Y3C3_9NEIS|nr:ClpXP protease specificity-enhancing factor [Crenobacter cavernae]AXK38425.1 ClpXP protease specificity-enhancing factor [Crenobacter cavernae]RXZ43578.1 ClpXP protease specificity-enhancing factor [Crenobacter cavernae]
MAGSTKPYLIRALHEWCTDNGHTPYVVVWVDGRTQVPHEFVKDNEIVLNIGYNATQGLKIANDWLSFSARFGGVSRDIWVPVGNVLSIFARETGEGMGFEVELAADATPAPTEAPATDPKPDGDGGGKPPAARGHLRVVK